VQRDWTQVTKDTGAGNPYESTVEKGRRYLEVVVGKVADFFVDLAETPREGFYEG
jgi:creatinine amidohydrolase